MKKVLLLTICLLVLLAVYSHAKMYSLIGKIGFDSESYRDNVYNYIVDHSTKCINTKKIDRYDVWNATGTVYFIDLQLNFSNVNKSFRDKVWDKAKTVKNDSRTVSMKIGVFISHNDGIPGACEPDKILIWELK